MLLGYSFGVIFGVAVIAGVRFGVKALSDAKTHKVNGAIWLAASALVAGAVFLREAGEPGTHLFGTLFVGGSSFLSPFVAAAVTDWRNLPTKA